MCDWEGIFLGLVNEKNKKSPFMVTKAAFIW